MRCMSPLTARNDDLLMQGAAVLRAISLSPNCWLLQALSKQTGSYTASIMVDNHVRRS